MHLNASICKSARSELRSGKDTLHAYSIAIKYEGLTERIRSPEQIYLSKLIVPLEHRSADSLAVQKEGQLNEGQNESCFPAYRKPYFKQMVKVTQGTCSRGQKHP